MSVSLTNSLLAEVKNEMLTFKGLVLMPIHPVHFLVSKTRLYSYRFCFGFLL
jgi:hypothetical protein